MAKQLSPEAKKLHSKVCEEWSITDAAGLFLLERALECFDEMRAAQEVLKTEGTYILDRFKQKRLHPAATREKESRAHMLAAFKQLNLDLESLK